MSEVWIEECAAMKENQFKCLTVQLFKALDVEIPTERQLRLVHKLLRGARIQPHLSYDDKLTEREITCLFLATRGLTSLETAKLMGIKKSTVVTHKRKILKKLSCHTFAQAIFEGICLSYISQKTKD